MWTIADKRNNGLLFLNQDQDNKPEQRRATDTVAWTNCGINMKIKIVEEDAPLLTPYTSTTPWPIATPAATATHTF